MVRSHRGPTCQGLLGLVYRGMWVCPAAHNEIPETEDPSQGWCTAGGGGSVMDLMSPASKAGGETRPSRSRDPLSVFLGAEEPKGRGSVLQFPLPQGDLPRSPPDYK